MIRENCVRLLVCEWEYAYGAIAYQYEELGLNLGQTNILSNGTMKKLE
jgi:hypothetical protein